MTIHDICEQATHVPCVCGATPDQPCTCGPRPVHAARIYHARRAGLVGMDDVAYILRNYPSGVVDPGERVA